MDAQWKIKWLEALRSGKYEQTQHCLRDTMEWGIAGSLKDIVGEEQNKYCCLGVLGDMFGLTEEEWEPYESINIIGEVDWANMLPPRVLNSLDIEMRQQTELALMNDRGDTFYEIADHIEKNL